MGLIKYNNVMHSLIYSTVFNVILYGLQRTCITALLNLEIYFTRANWQGGKKSWETFSFLTNGPNGVNNKGY